MAMSKLAASILRPATPIAKKPPRFNSEELNKRLNRKKKNGGEGGDGGDGGEDDPVIERDIDKELPHGRCGGRGDGPDGR